MSWEGPGGRAGSSGGQEFDFGPACFDIQGEIPHSLWRRGFGGCGKTWSCDVEGISSKEMGLQPRQAVLQEKRPLDSGVSER